MDPDHQKPPPPHFVYRTPWLSDTNPAACEELYREVAPDHLLHGIRVNPIARRQDCDDFLFQLTGDHRPAAFAVVHLTWSGKPETCPGFPGTELFATFDDWNVRCHNPEADEWEETERFCQEYERAKGRTPEHD